MVCHVPEIIFQHNHGIMVSCRVAANIIKIIAVSCLNLVIGRTERSEVLIDLQESLRERTSFIRFISHEVRTPLNVICVGLTVLEGLLEELLKGVGECSRDVMDTLSSMQDASNTAVETLKDMLDFDKLESGLMKVDLAPISIPEFIR